MKPIKRVAIIFNPYSEESLRLSDEIAGWLTAHSIQVWRGVSHEGRAQHAVDHTDLVLALGGDGTVLRAARLAIPSGVPVLPVALGRLNFMAELEPSTLYQGLEDMLAGRFWLDSRTLVEATVQRADGITVAPILALNEIIVARGDINRTVLVDVEIYDARLTTYHADGVIVASATGSTAYALAAGVRLWDALLTAGATPCGLGARDVLRTEAGLHLYGHELTDDTNPIEAGLGWLVSDRTDYIGAAAIAQAKQHGVARKLMGVRLTERSVPREGYPVCIDGAPVSTLTSGVYSPTLEQGIGMAYLPTEYAKAGTPCAVEIRGKAVPAVVSTRRFLKGG